MVGGNIRKAIFLSYLLIIFILFLSLTSIVFELTGVIFIVELMFLGLSLLISIIILRGIHLNKPGVSPITLIFFSVQLLNLIGMLFSVNLNKVVLPLSVSVIGMFLVMTHLGRREPKTIEYKIVGNSSKKTSKSVKKKAAKKTAKKTSKKKSKKKTTKKKR